MDDGPRPRLRGVEGFPTNQANGEVFFALRDPEGFSQPVVIPYAAAVLCSLMDGTRTPGEIQAEFQRRFGQPVATADLERLIAQLDDRYYLDTERFRAKWKQEIELYLNNRVRPAAHAGGAYAGEAESLKKQLASLFVHPSGPGEPNGSAAKPSAGRLCGVLSPHIDLHRGGPAFAWAYKKIVEESDADLFVIFGTAHRWMRYPFSVLRKHFNTPLGIVETDLAFAARLAARLTSLAEGADLSLFADDLAHRNEHSIEFQTIFLQYLLGQRRPFKIVPVLTGSFHEFVSKSCLPLESPGVAAFCQALRSVVAEYEGKACYISGSDLAHIGQRFGDSDLLTPERLQAQSASDQNLLAAACRSDAADFFLQVAKEQDRNRICGLSPTYAMLEVMRPARGEFLKYDQAVEPDGTSCVSFASLAFYE